MIYWITDLIHIQPGISFIAYRDTNLVNSCFFTFGSVALVFSSSTLAALLVWTFSIFLKIRYFFLRFSIIFQAVWFSNFILMFVWVASPHLMPVALASS